MTRRRPRTLVDRVMATLDGEQAWHMLSVERAGDNRDTARELRANEVYASLRALSTEELARRAGHVGPRYLLLAELTQRGVE